MNNMFMKSLVNALLFGLLLNSAEAQNELQKCAEKMSNEINNVVMQGKANDTAALRKFTETEKEWRACVSGKSIPDFNIKTISGQELNTEKLRGKILVINFWYIACIPCIAEMPALNQLVSEYKDKDVLFLGLTFENKEDIVNTFLPKFKFDFTIIPNAQFVEDSFGVSTHPSIFIVDKKGKVKQVWAGGDIGENARKEAYLKAKPIIDELLKGE